mgnify:CR=1 FL=1
MEHAQSRLTGLPHLACSLGAAAYARPPTSSERRTVSGRPACAHWPSQNCSEVHCTCSLPSRGLPLLVIAPVSALARADCSSLARRALTSPARTAASQRRSSVGREGGQDALARCPPLARAACRPHADPAADCAPCSTSAPPPSCARKHTISRSFSHVLTAERARDRDAPARSRLAVLLGLPAPVPQLLRALAAQDDPDEDALALVTLGVPEGNLEPLEARRDEWRLVVGVGRRVVEFEGGEERGGRLVVLAP